jgi:hypothetical protein
VIQLAILAVAVSVRIGLSVLLPQETQGDIAFLQFFANFFPVRERFDRQIGCLNLLWKEQPV